MFVAVTAGLGAGALWGLTFIAPHLVGEATAGELVLARYGFYGVVSVAYLRHIGYNPFARLGRAEWARLVLLGALGNTIYYLFMAMSVAAGSSGLTALVIGTLPVMFAIVGNLQRPALRWSRLAPAILPIAAGMLLLARPGSGDAAFGFSQAGLILALAAMTSWLAYGLLNASYLASRPHMSAMTWSALMGIGTLITLPFAAAGVLLSGGALSGSGAPHYGPLLLWGLVLGIFSSWLATWLWNVASARIPPAILGYLIVSETVFALIYSFMFHQRLPTGIEAASMALMVGGTLLGLHMARTPRRTPRIPPVA